MLMRLRMACPHQVLMLVLVVEEGGGLEAVAVRSCELDGRFMTFGGSRLVMVYEHALWCFSVDL